MTVLPNFTTFRSTFAAAAFSFNDTLSFVNANPSTITRATGDFLAEGFTDHDKIAIAATVSNNGNYTIRTATASTLTLVPGNTLVNEAAIFTVYTGEAFDVDGLETWPTQSLRINGFNNTLAGVRKPGVAGIPMVVTANNYQADAVFNADEYDWYLSQRSDLAANQAFTIVQRPNVGFVSFSGTVHIALLFAKFGKLGNERFSPSDIIRFFKHTHLYVQRRSDKAIQWVDLLRKLTANA